MVAAALMALAAIAAPWARVALGATDPALLETQPATDHPAGPPAQVELPLADEEQGDRLADVLPVFWEAWWILQEEYLDRSALQPRRLAEGAIGGIVRSLDHPDTPTADGSRNRSAPDARRLTYGAIRGLVESLEDPGTRFQTPEERAAEAAGWSGRLEGIGACLEMRAGVVSVSASIEAGPAARAGIRAGDVILAVDGRPVDGLPVREVVSRIRGPRGTSVALTIRRPDAAAPVDATVVRDEIRLISASALLVEPGIGLLRLTAFTEQTDEETGAALEDLRRQGAGALVIDVRGNPGGWLDPAIAVTSRFVPSGPLLWKEDGRGDRQPYDRHADQPLVDGPLAVLIDRGTASAAEVLAAALRDAGRARLIGRPTYGKGTVQYAHELSDGSGLFVTAARWVSPAGKRLDRGGLAPDVPVDVSGTDSADPALEQAVELLRRALPSNPGRPVGRPPPTTGCTPGSVGAA